jgi:DNA-binding transcriptional MerR regulator
MSTITTAELSIADVSRRTGVSAHTLRYYERIGLIEPVGRAGSGHRRYDAADVRWVEVLTKLRRTGMPIRRMQEYAELVRAGDGNERARLELLEAHRDEVRAQLEEVARHLEFIEHKIEIYQERTACH